MVLYQCMSALRCGDKDQCVATRLLAALDDAEERIKELTNKSMANTGRSSASVEGDEANEDSVVGQLSQTWLEAIALFRRYDVADSNCSTRG